MMSATSGSSGILLQVISWILCVCVGYFSLTPFNELTFLHFIPSRVQLFAIIKYKLYKILNYPTGCSCAPIKKDEVLCLVGAIGRGAAPGFVGFYRLYSRSGGRAARIVSFVPASLSADLDKKLIRV